MAGVREKCCRRCLLLLVKKAFAAELAKLRQRLAEQQNQHEPCTRLTCLDREAGSEGPPLFVALSGGDASTSLLHAADELVQKRLRARLMQRQKQNRQGSASSEKGVRPTREDDADFGCCVALHVDMQRLFLPPGRVLEVVVSTSSHHKSPAEVLGADAHASERLENSDAAYTLGLPAPTQQSLPLQLQQTVSRHWPSVRCVLLHPLGTEFSIVEAQRAEHRPRGFAEIHRQPGGDSCTQEQLESIIQQEDQLRDLLAQTFAEDKTAAEHLCRAIMLGAVRKYFFRRHGSATHAQGLPPAFLCVGDSAAVAALGVLERVTYGEGRLLATESAPLDDRHLPLFHLCRPFVELSKKELALFRLFEGLSAVPTRPYLLHEDHLPFSVVGPVRNPHPSVRWLLQDFLVELLKDNAAILHNLLSASRKLEPTFIRWSQHEIPCCLCWKAPAVDLGQILCEPHVVTPRQLRIAKEHLLPNTISKRLCFACIRDATAAASASRIARILACDMQVNCDEGNML